MSNVLKIVHIIIGFIAIFVIDGQSLWTGTYKIMSHEAVNSKPSLLPISGNSNDAITSPIRLYFEKFSSTNRIDISIAINAVMTVETFNFATNKPGDHHKVKVYHG